MIDWTPDRIKSLRLKYGLSQQKLGLLTGVSGNYIYMLEGGERNPSKTLCLLLERIENELRENEKGKESDLNGKESKRTL